jgi:hypothetical protein
MLQLAVLCCCCCCSTDLLQTICKQHFNVSVMHSQRFCCAALLLPLHVSSPGGSSPPQRCPRGLMTEDEGATAEGQCSAPPGWFLPGDGSSSDMQECPSGTYKEVRRAGTAAAAAAIHHPLALQTFLLLAAAALYPWCPICCSKTLDRHLTPDLLLLPASHWLLCCLCCACSGLEPRC